MANSKEQHENLIGDEPAVKMEVVRKIIVDPDTIAKMKRLASLYADEIPEGAKEIDIISFFFNKAFQLFLRSGEIESKVKEITK